MKNFRVFYDEKEDILYLAKQGQEEEVMEVAPGVNLEFDKGGQLIGVELLNASTLLKDVIKPMEKEKGFRGGSWRYSGWVQTCRR
jgi:uncharacterized protein YuzE